MVGLYRLDGVLRGSEPILRLEVVPGDLEFDQRRLLVGRYRPTPGGDSTFRTYWACESRVVVSSIAVRNSGSAIVSVSSWIRTFSWFGLSPAS